MENNQTFNKVKELLLNYKDKFLVTHNSEKRVELYADTDYEVTSERTGKTTKKHGLFFASVILYNTYTGLYLTAQYMEPEMLTMFKQKYPRLMKMLKGKSCFHVIKWDSESEQEITGALKDSYEYFKKKGYIL
jgi:hypothetical protein